ncbi:alpha/beta fold hydrolase [Halalkalibacter oceani]|uniref:alpha/beta fold hydrolase n=1 Tax=Halalkalibacter oceani TaxID=1653776 RepID=UPI003394D072
MAVPAVETVNVRDNISAKVLIAGEGKPLVYLHGAGGLQWDGYLDRLAEHYKVYAPYHIGTGGSLGKDEIRDWWDLVLYYYELFDALGLEQVDIIGHSFGGMVAAELAATNPERVTNLVLVCAAGLWLDEAPVKDVFTMLNTPDVLFQHLFADLHSPAAQAFANAAPEDERERIDFMVAQNTAAAEAAKFMWGIPDKGLSRRIHRVKANSCIIWGAKDALVPVDYAYEYHKKLPGSQVVIMENSGHYPQAEELDAVVDATLQFLQAAHVTK